MKPSHFKIGFLELFVHVCCWLYIDIYHFSQTELSTYGHFRNAVKFFDIQYYFHDYNIELWEH